MFHERLLNCLCTYQKLRTIEYTLQGTDLYPSLNLQLLEEITCQETIPLLHSCLLFPTFLVPSFVSLLPSSDPGTLYGTARDRSETFSCFLPYSRPSRKSLDSVHISLGHSRLQAFLESYVCLFGGYFEECRCPGNESPSCYLSSNFSVGLMCSFFPKHKFKTEPCDLLAVSLKLRKKGHPYLRIWSP